MKVQAVREIIGKFVPDGGVRADLTSAAVMITIFVVSEELFVILNRRTRTLPRHKGEVCFPGGTMDCNDPDLKYTALRELNEEMGISPNEVEVFGSIGNVQTNTGFDITPFVGFINYPYTYEVNEDEVESIIEFPIENIFGDQCERSLISDNEYPVFEFDGDIVFGATARILSDFCNLIAPAIIKE
tara:strand:- start:347 stop:904 length:558 start_codon:yes stop_codon:yes gene_type:complete